MAPSIKFTKLNNNYASFQGDRNLIYELRARYSFYAQNYKWDKRYKLGYWDGKLSLINLKDYKVYLGIIPEIKAYLDQEGIEYVDETGFSELGQKISIDEINQFYKDIKAPFIPHKEQAESVQNCIQMGRNLIVAPTSLGKSYIIHGLNAWYSKKKLKTLIIINRSTLVLQLKSNFVDEYNSESIYSTSTIYEEDNDTDVVVSTWQSLTEKPASWFKQFQVLICDEVHTAKSKSIRDMIEKCSHIEHRHGVTATLDNDSKIDALTLEGMFGPPFVAITLKEQIDKGISAKPIVYVVYLKYSAKTRSELREEIKQQKKEADSKGKPTDTIPFRVESEFLENHSGRNKIINNLVKLQKGNTLVAFKNKEHGKLLLDGIKSIGLKHPIFFANGTVSKTKRFEIQKTIETLEQSTSVVSFGTFSTGINIPNLHNLIIASQVKSDITIPQLIGRMIRLFEGKTTANVIDICDDLSHNEVNNIFLNHFKKRLHFYMKNNFEIKTKVISV